MTSPADELRAAAQTLRQTATIGAYTATPAGAALLRAREPLAQWLCATASHLDANTHPGWQETTAGLPLAVARAINGDAR
jgi:hypothetical protein